VETADTNSGATVVTVVKETMVVTAVATMVAAKVVVDTMVAASVVGDASATVVVTLGQR